jgi:hypothetical protein
MPQRTANKNCPRFAGNFCLLEHNGIELKAHSASAEWDEMFRIVEQGSAL